MKNKILTGLATLALTLSASADTGGTHIWKFTPLLSGCNVQFSNNAVGYGQSNVLYTTTRGQIVDSYTFGPVLPNGSNAYFGDAFQPVSLVPDANADINANASIWLMFGNTNWIPWVATNSVGQYFTPIGLTNGAIQTSLAGLTVPLLTWPLGVGGAPNWMYPATTNYYATNFWAGTAAANVTNQFFVTLYASPGSVIFGGEGNDLNPKVYLGENIPSFTFTFTMTNCIPGLAASVPGAVYCNTPFIIQTNLPIGFLQHAKMVYMTISATNTSYTVGTNLNPVLLNMAGILQPQ